MFSVLNVVIVVCVDFVWVWVCVFEVCKRFLFVCRILIRLMMFFWYVVNEVFCVWFSEFMFCVSIVVCFLCLMRLEKVFFIFCVVCNIVSWYVVSIFVFCFLV